MRNVTDLTRQVCTLALAAAILSPLPLAAETWVRQVKWEDLSIVTGQTVRISLPGGIVTGKAGTVEADALVVDVQKTSDQNAYPKGTLRVPREKLHRLEMQTKSKNFRVGGSIAAGMLAVSVGAIAAWNIDGCGLMTGCPHGYSSGGVAAAVGISAAGIAGGYSAGNALDKHWTAIEIVP